MAFKDENQISTTALAWQYVTIELRKSVWGIHGSRTGLSLPIIPNNIQLRWRESTIYIAMAFKDENPISTLPWLLNMLPWSSGRVSKAFMALGQG